MTSFAKRHNAWFNNLKKGDLIQVHTQGIVKLGVYLERLEFSQVRMYHSYQGTPLSYIHSEDNLRFIPLSSRYSKLLHYERLEGYPASRCTAADEKNLSKGERKAYEYVKSTIC